MTIPVPGKPETAVSDEAGKIYVNIEDKNSISEIDLTSGKVLNTWSLSPAEGPTGLVIDLKTKMLFAGCEKLLVGMSASTGRISSTLPIGEGCDGVAFDPEYSYVFASCGEGSLYVAKENAGGDCQIIDSIPTKRSARTITIDKDNHEVFMPAADFEKGPQAKGVSWEKEKGNYEANWGGKSGEDHSAQFTPSGEFLEIAFPTGHKG